MQKENEKRKSHLILLYRLFELILQKWHQMVVYMLEHLLHGWHHLSNTDFFFGRKGIPLRRGATALGKVTLTRSSLSTGSRLPFSLFGRKSSLSPQTNSFV